MITFHWIELGGLIKFIRPFLKTVSKAKAAKLVRNLVDIFLDMEATTGMEVHVETKLNVWGSGMAQWWRTCLPPLWPGFDSLSQHHKWVAFVVGSFPYSERFFSRYPGFLLSSKTNVSKFQFNLESEGHRFISRKDC